jgi:hypothetical protein
LQYPIYNRGFETAKDVRRHQNDVYKTKKRYFCFIDRYKYAHNRNKVGDRDRGVERKKGGFPRKNNLKRHLRRRHSTSDENLEEGG